MKCPANGLRQSYPPSIESTQPHSIQHQPYGSELSDASRCQHEVSPSNDNSMWKDRKNSMGNSRCFPFLASANVRRALVYKMAVISVFSTVMVFCVHQYIAPNYQSIIRVASLDRVYNGSYVYIGSLLGSSAAVVGERRLPSVIIFGVSKCGTRAMLEYLKLHPSIVAAGIEIDYFNNDTLFSRGASWYLQQMPLSRDGQLTVEKSPDYFQNPKCAFRIWQFRKDIKLILLLRDPTERLISQYMQLIDKNPGRLPSFEEWAVNPSTGLVNTNVPSIRVSEYSEHLVSWLNTFPRDNIHIIESWSLRENPLLEMKRVEHFLNIRPYFEPRDFYFNDTRGFYCLRYRSTDTTKCLGKSKGRQHIPVDRRIRQLLQAYYEPFNAKLSQMLGFKFAWS